MMLKKGEERRSEIVLKFAGPGNRVPGHFGKESHANAASRNVNSTDLSPEDVNLSRVFIHKLSLSSAELCMPS